MLDKLRNRAYFCWRAKKEIICVGVMLIPFSIYSEVIILLFFICVLLVGILDILEKYFDNKVEEYKNR